MGDAAHNWLHLREERRSLDRAYLLGQLSTLSEQSSSHRRFRRLISPRITHPMIDIIHPYGDASGKANSAQRGQAARSPMPKRPPISMSRCSLTAVSIPSTAPRATTLRAGRGAYLLSERRSRWPGRSAGCRTVPSNRARQKARRPASPRQRTRSSNPVPSRRESANHQFLTGGSDVRPKAIGHHKRGPRSTSHRRRQRVVKRQSSTPPSTAKAHITQCDITVSAAPAVLKTTVAALAQPPKSWAIFTKGTRRRSGFFSLPVVGSGEAR